MKKIISALIILISLSRLAIAQNIPVSVNTVIDAEKNFNKLVERKGIKGGFLAVADPAGIVFKPDAVNITDFYNNIDKQAGALTWTPNFARISTNGDLAFTAGPYVYQNGTNDTDKVFGDYVSIWRTDGDNKLKLLIDLGIQHPEPEIQNPDDFKEPNTQIHVSQSKDPFNGKRVILSTDNVFNHSLTISTIGSYKEFLSNGGRFYFPGFEPIIGQEKIMQFIANEGINITAETVDVGRAISNDLACATSMP